MDSFYKTVLSFDISRSRSLENQPIFQIVRSKESRPLGLAISSRRRSQ